MNPNLLLNFFEIKSLFIEIDDGFMLRRLILTNVGV